MAFWSTEKILENIEDIVILSNENTVKTCSCELTLGREVYVTSNNKSKHKLNYVGDSVSIPPGQFSILLTEEIVKIPDNAMGFISIKAGVKFKGLVNVSGFHVDPGFYGRLKFAVYNAGAGVIHLQRGDRVFLLWLADITDKTKDLYNDGIYKENGISSKDLDNMIDEVASPAQLKIDIDKLFNRIEELENRDKLKTTVFKLVIGFVFTVLIFLARKL